MKIIFVVNTTGLTGGIRAVLVHAKNLATLGHKTEVIHLLRLEKKFLALLKAYLKKIKYLILKIFNINPTKWFGDIGDVKIRRLIKLKNLGEFDCIIATANETADFVNELSVDKEKKFYFVQDYETWTRDKEKVDATYRMPLKKIIISNELESLMKEKFNQETLGPGVIGFDRQEFPPTLINNNNKNIIILMQYHVLAKKGINFGLEALKMIKQEFPEIKIKMFGPYRINEKIDFDFEYFFNLSRKKLTELFCEADIFLFPSLQEGFALPPLEAMAAGCAVVATRVGALPDYVKDGETAILVEPRNANALYLVIKDLIKNPDKLNSLKENSPKNINVPSWFEASQELERILLTSLKIK